MREVPRVSHLLAACGELWVSLPDNSFEHGGADPFLLLRVAIVLRVRPRYESMSKLGPMRRT